MRKMPTIFQRDTDNRALVTPKPHPDCAWVFAGEGVATRKYDGTCVLIRGGRMYKRREVRPGKEPPPDFELVETDLVTGKSVGWVPVGDGPEDRWHREALEWLVMVRDGTYELCGPKVQGNPEGFDKHVLIQHADAERLDGDFLRTFDSMRGYLRDYPGEGIVFHHPDGRMAKIKRKDFGFR